MNKLEILIKIHIYYQNYKKNYVNFKIDNSFLLLIFIIVQDYQKCAEKNYFYFGIYKYPF